MPQALSTGSTAVAATDAGCDAATAGKMLIPPTRGIYSAASLGRHILQGVRMSGNQGVLGWDFPSTRWSLIAKAGGVAAAADERRAALDAVLRQYLPALRVYLLSKSLRPDLADDILQGFLADRVIHDELLASADRARGRFRFFLLTSLKNYASNHFRREQALKRSPSEGRMVPLPADESEIAASEPQDVFEIEWARELLREAIRRMKEDCQSSGRQDLWDVFEGRILAPAFGGAEPVDYEELMTRHGFQSAKQAFNVLVTAKRTFDRTLRRLVRVYAAEEEVESELESLRRTLSGSR